MNKPSPMLTKLATAAVRVVNKENGIALKKVAQFGDYRKGAVVYRDSEYNEYRVLYFADIEHLTKADYHTSDKQDALDTAMQFALPEPHPEIVVDKMQAETDSAVAAIEAAADAQIAVKSTPDVVSVDEVPNGPVRSRPRGYYSHPSPLLAGMLMKNKYVN